MSSGSNGAVGSRSEAGVTDPAVARRPGAMGRLATSGLGLVGAGFACVWLAEATGAAGLWLVGLVLVALGLPATAVGLAWTAWTRLTGPRPGWRPGPPEVPGVGSPGWVFELDGRPHEVWLDFTSLRFRIACDGAWAVTRRVGGRGLAFDIDGHAALLTSTRDRRGTPIPPEAVVAGGMTDSWALSLRFTRYDLAIDGTLLPDTARRVWMPPRPATPAPRQAPERPLRLDPPGR